MIEPSGPVAVVPATCTTDPTRTAREYPTIGSHGVPLEMFWRGMLLFRHGWSLSINPAPALRCNVPRARHPRAVGARAGPRPCARPQGVGEPIGGGSGRGHRR